MTNVHVVILGLLCNKPLHGYEVKQIIEDHMGDWTDIKFGSIYFALSKLKDQGSVDILPTSQSGNRPARKVYQITNKGREEYKRLLRKLWMHDGQTLYALDIALFFMQSLPKEEVLGYISGRIKACEQTLKHLDVHESEQAVRMPRQGRYIFDHSKMHMKAELTWLKKVAADIRQE